MTSEPATMEKLSTGSAAFDRILGGGLPGRSLTVIAGEPGAGKTLFSLQVLFHLARQGKKCIYFTTLSEPSLKLVHHMQKFSFFDEEAIGKQLLFVDLGSVIRSKDADATLEEITARVEREEPAMVVIDSFKALRDTLGDAPSLRMFTYDLAVYIAGWGAATLFVGEYTEEEMEQFAEFAIADGILRFGSRRQDLTAMREVEIFKMRGAAYVGGPHFFEIGDGGLEFFPRVRGPAPLAAAPAGAGVRVNTGVAGFDALLDGGLPRFSATVLQGGTGTGKTLLGLQFLLEGARLGEPGIHFALEETPEQLREIAHGFGWPLADFEQRGLITLSYFSPVELSPDLFLQRARQQVQKLKARRAVLDSLTSLSLGVPSERRFKELVYAFTKHFRALGVTLQMNMEVAELLGAAQLSGHGVSFAADNVIQLKYLELDGHLERGLSVLKARGVRHGTAVHRMHFQPDGIKLGAAYEGMRGVLTGLPSPG